MRERAVIIPHASTERARDGVIKGAVEEAIGVGGGDDQVEFGRFVYGACSLVFALFGDVGEGAV